FVGTASKFIFKPSASSPIATETPPAPKSLHFFIIVLTQGFLKRVCILLSIGGLPFCTSAPDVIRDSSVCSLDEPVAPPHPSLPVLPPSKIITSPGTGFSLTTFFIGAAAITAPSSILFATYPSSYISSTCPAATPIWFP